MKLGFAIDRGGTFTDVFVQRPDGSSRVLKLLSEDPANYKDAPTEGIRRILEAELGQNIARGDAVPTENIAWIRMGTTVATNALLERKGERTALVVTKHFADLLHIGNQARPKIFDLTLSRPEHLYDTVVEADERIVLVRPDCGLEQKGRRHVGLTGDEIEVWRELDEEVLEADLRRIYETGIRSLAVALIHSYIWPDHERRIGEIAKSIGFPSVSLSSDVMRMARIVPRAFTATADAYLTPVIQRYISTFLSGFENNLRGAQVLFMQSHGGLCPVDSFYGSRAILSGPAGGVTGVAQTAWDGESPVIGFDMGGTSTDVARFAGEYEHVFETTTAGVTIQAPQLDINTVAAGGGSRLFYEGGLFVVGPESAGANPGPVCYGKEGGLLAVTDANLVLGRILPSHFPRIFGPNEDEPLNIAACMTAFESLSKSIPGGMSIDDVALGFIDVANEAMCRPVRALTEARGFDTQKHVLSCFGGAGGQHACAIAKGLGMTRVFIHKHASILSAYGLALADVVEEAQEPISCTFEEAKFDDLRKRIQRLSASCTNTLQSYGFNSDQISTKPYLNMRYDRTNCALMCAEKSLGSFDFLDSFYSEYQREFGFLYSDDRPVKIDDIRVVGTAKLNVLSEPSSPDSSQSPVVHETVKCCFREGGRLDTNVYMYDQLQSKHELIGPALIIDSNSTIVVEPNCRAVITPKRDIFIYVGENRLLRSISTSLDPIQLSIFSHRFMSIAEQMGRILQRTAASTNIKERLDFSCALFGPDGGLIANAPHIPVHLGSMQETVRYQLNEGDGFHRGDVILCNHPVAGGTHLPDLTVITPVFLDEHEQAVYYVASRGHHADIGGIVPGSMPPHATSIQQEGAAFIGFRLVKNGIFQEDDVTDALNAPAKHEGCSGTRNLADNIGDLKAQIAANQRGIGLVKDLINEYSLEVVQAEPD